MKLTLLILALIGVVSATTEDSNSSETVAQDLENIENVKVKEIPSSRGLRKCNYWATRDHKCNQYERCSKGNVCVVRRKYMNDYTYDYDYDDYNQKSVGGYCKYDYQCRSHRCNTNRRTCLPRSRYYSNYDDYYSSYDGSYNNNKSIGDRCSRSSQCRGSLKCRSNRCVPESGAYIYDSTCHRDSDCGSNEWCDRGYTDYRYNNYRYNRVNNHRVGVCRDDDDF